MWFSKEITNWPKVERKQIKKCKVSEWLWRFSLLYIYTLPIRVLVVVSNHHLPNHLLWFCQRGAVTMLLLFLKTYCYCLLEVPVKVLNWRYNQGRAFHFLLRTVLSDLNQLIGSLLSKFWHHLQIYSQNARIN